jgi:phage gp46-like protein
MGDFALTWDGFGADLFVQANDLAASDDLVAGVFLSLFTNRRAEPGDVLPDGESDPQGYWGDLFPTVAGDKFGSRLWLLRRAKPSQDTLDRATQYAREALQWMLDDLLAERVDVSAEQVKLTPHDRVLLLTVTIYRPKSAPVRYRYNYNWQSQEARAA